MPKTNYSIRFTIVDDSLLAQLEQHQIEVVLLEVAINEPKEEAQIHEMLIDELKQFYQSSQYRKEYLLTHAVSSKGFSERDLKVLTALCDGLSSKEIGEQLFVSKKTIDLIRTKLLRTYDVKTSNELIRLSIIDGLYTPRSNEAIQAEKARLAQQQIERRKRRLQGE